MRDATMQTSGKLEKIACTFFVLCEISYSFLIIKKNILHKALEFRSLQWVQRHDCLFHESLNFSFQWIEDEKFNWRPVFECAWSDGFYLPL